MKRREFLALSVSSLGFVIGKEIFFGEKVLAETKKFFLNSAGERFVNSLPSFEGIFIFDPQQLLEYADDFGHSVKRIPSGALKPANAEDIRLLCQYCKKNGFPLSARGTGGSAYGQTQVENGIVVDTSSLKSIRWLNATDVELGPGLIWKEVLDFTIRAQRTPPVIPDTPVISVGGSVNVGGIGETSYRLGAIVDHIVEFDLVTLDGSILTCSSVRNPALFRQALGSMGQFGIMTRIVMRTMIAPDQVRSYQLKYEGLDFQYLIDAKRISEMEREGAIGGHLVRKPDQSFAYVLDVTTWSQEGNPAWLSQIKAQSVSEPKSWSFYDYATRNMKSWNDAINAGKYALPHPYLSFYIPYEQGVEFARFIQSNADANQGAGKIMISPLNLTAFGLCSHKLPQSRSIVHGRIYRIVQTERGGSDHLKMLRHNEQVLVPKILAAGGKVYLPFSPLLSSSQQRMQFQESIEDLLSTKKALNPNSLLNPGAGILSLP